jgi:hypothetical protein
VTTRTHENKEIEKIPGWQTFLWEVGGGCRMPKKQEGVRTYAIYKRELRQTTWAIYRPSSWTNNIAQGLREGGMRGDTTAGCCG